MMNEDVPDAGNWELRGRIVRGLEKAADFTQLDWVQAQCHEKLGFKPFPGTLNLEISEEYLPVIEAMQGASGIRLIPPDPAFCEAKTFSLTIGSIRGAAIIPEENVRIHGKGIIEILAAVKLKDALQVDDGDSVTLYIKKSEPPHLQRN